MPAEEVLALPATWMRGGTSKGLFFRTGDLPAESAARDALLLRAIGSPDPYGRQIDGVGGATSSTSKVVLVQRSRQPGCDVDYLFGAVAIEQPLIDWSGSCGNLAAAVGPFALQQGMLEDAPADGIAQVRIWQANLGERIIAHVPMRGGQVLETGKSRLDGVAFGGAEIRLDFLDPAGGARPLLPTGRVRDLLRVPGLGPVEATLINAGNPTAIVAASALGLAGVELPQALNPDVGLLARCEAVRAQAAVAMGLARDAPQATRERPATPKLALVAAPVGYAASDGRAVVAEEIDLLVRMLSMGPFHHALPGTGAIALAAAAALPGTLVADCAGARGG
ncbi:MAG: 2-methylaconitate cis-trans isomerase PrpF, partial [Gammaproteobacteria bacterium]|nr:2-methylaconitate cis-trans isomerase PrpF [Gammaproteobacteria bacterium]